MRVLSNNLHLFQVTCFVSTLQSKSFTNHITTLITILTPLSYYNNSEVINSITSNLGSMLNTFIIFLDELNTTVDFDGLAGSELFLKIAQ